MKEIDYFNEIESLIKSLEVKKKIRTYKNNSETVLTYWTTGKLLIDVQGGHLRAKYGNELVKKWSAILTEKYGKGYDISNLKRFKKFYLLYQKRGPVGHPFISWSHIRYILPLKDENERNYYINQVIEKGLSKNELIREIKSNSYGRLLNKPEHIDIINNNELLPTDKIKNPIIINLEKNKNITNEHELELLILSQLSFFLNQLGDNYLFKDNQYKVMIDGHYKYIDVLLFNLEINCFVVVEFKLRKINEKDVAQTKIYMDAIDKKLKTMSQNKTMGIIISKENDKLVANFIKNNDFNIIPLEYELKELLKK